MSTTYKVFFTPKSDPNELHMTFTDPPNVSVINEIFEAFLAAGMAPRVTRATEEGILP